MTCLSARIFIAIVVTSNLKPVNEYYRLVLATHITLGEQRTQIKKKRNNVWHVKSYNKSFHPGWSGTNGEILTD